MASSAAKDAETTFYEILRIPLTASRAELHVGYRLRTLIDPAFADLSAEDIYPACKAGAGFLQDRVTAAIKRSIGEQGEWR